MTVLSQQEVDKLWSQIEEVVWAHNKATAKPLASRLRFKAESFEFRDPYVRGKLIEAIRHAEDASGQVPDKDHWLGWARNSFSVFASNMRAERNRSAEELK